MQSLLDWLVTLPQAALYAILFITAAIENLFPPFPSDVVVAFGGFVVAQAPGGTMLGVFLAVWIGNVGGAMLVYALGRRYGAERMERRLAGALGIAKADVSLKAKSNEGLGWIGRGEGIACVALATLASE